MNKSLDVGGNIVLSSGSFLHGDENNANVAGGTNGEGAFISSTGTGWIPSYAVINLQSTYHVNKYAEIFARLVNVANKQYSTAGFLTSNSFTPNGTFETDPDDWTNENSVSPAQPRAIFEATYAPVLHNSRICEVLFARPDITALPRRLFVNTLNYALLVRECSVRSGPESPRPSSATAILNQGAQRRGNNDGDRGFRIRLMRNQWPCLCVIKKVCSR